LFCALKGPILLSKATRTGQNQSDLQSQVEEKDTTVDQPTAIPVSRPLTHLLALLENMRPRQWTKNFAVFIGLVFAQRLFDLIALERATVAFIAFCLISSCIYIINDLLDLERDQQHPVKRLRPLASGRLSVPWAIVGVVILLLLCTALTGTLYTLPMQGTDTFAHLGGANFLFTFMISAYFIIQVLYSLRLKHIVLVDVFTIASGFVLRIIAGVVIIPVSISAWLYLVASFLALFLALSKRRHELVLLQDQAHTHRQILKEYSVPMLNQMITITTTATILSYSLYTIEGPALTHPLMITIPLVLYGMFRYLYLVYIRMEGGSPEEVLLRDHHMLGTVLLCIVLIITVLYILR
jgi:4-hydroxybenzoate polyprenyltransferase